MNVSHDVVLDLLPLYLAGEASQASRALVDAYMKEFPDIAERVRQAAAEPLTALPPASPSPDLEMRSLRRTMRLLTWQRWLLGLAIWLTCTPLATLISYERGQWQVRFLMNEYPTQLGICGVLAVQCWLYYFFVRYRLKTK